MRFCKINITKIRPYILLYNFIFNQELFQIFTSDDHFHLHPNDTLRFYINLAKPIYTLLL